MNVEIEDMAVDRDIKDITIRVLDVDMDLRGVWNFGIWIWTSIMEVDNKDMWTFRILK